MPLGTYYAYTASYLADAGVKDVSTAMSFGQMSEIVFMLVIPLLFRRLGVKYMLLIGMAAWFVRYAFSRSRSQRRGASCSIWAFCCTACAMTFLCRWLYLHRPRGGREGKGRAEHDCDVHLRDRHAAGLADLRRCITIWWPARVRLRHGDLLVDPGGGRRGYRADFPFLFPVQRERAALIFQEGYEND